MRAIVDANVLISMVLSPKGSVGTVLREVVSGSIELLVSAQSLDEVRHSCSTKPYLAQRISKRQLESFLESIASASILLPRIDPPFKAYTRDLHNDYLIAHVIAENVDVLVSGDHHLLDEKGRFSFQILSPAEFVTTYLTAD